MVEATSWLPALMLFEDWNGDWPRYLDGLHDAFLSDFVRGKPKWLGKRVSLKRHPEFEGKSATFWHFVSEGDVECDRLPDLRRCERIRWPRAMMDARMQRQSASGDRVLWWKEKRRSEVRYVLSTADFSYMLVVADRGEYVLPWTAYPLEYPHQRAKLERRCSNYWRAPW